MQTSTIHPPRPFEVVVTGDVDVAREAVARWVDIHRPLRNLGYLMTADVSVHVDVWATEAELRAWREGTVAPGEDGSPAPGSLTFYAARD